MKKLLFVIFILTFFFCNAQNQNNRELAKYHLGRGSTLYVLNDFQGAIAEYNLAIKSDKTYAAAYRCRGTAKIKLGQKEEACKDFVKAKELGDEYAQDEIDNNCQTELKKHK